MLYISQVLFSFIITIIFHKSTGLPQCTQPIKERGLTEMEKDNILVLHNDLRRKVLQGVIDGLPKARYMKVLEWDSQLESEAQRWLDLCPIPGPNAHPPNGWGKIRTGQNMAWGHGTFQEAIYDWFNEYKVYLKAGANPLIMRKDVNKDPELAELGLEGKQIGHFIAIVWANTSKIGCAQVKTPMDHHGYSEEVIYGCNYFPPGLIFDVTKNRPLLPYEIENKDLKPKFRSNKNITRDSLTSTTPSKIQYTSNELENEVPNVITSRKYSDQFYTTVSLNEYHDGNASKAEHFLKENKLKNNVEPFYDYFNNDENNGNENEIPKLMAMPQAFLTAKDSKKRFETNKEQHHYYHGISDDFLQADYNSYHSRHSYFDQLMLPFYNPVDALHRSL